MTSALRSEQIDTIKRLLKDGWTHRQIQRKTGINRGIIGRIYRGTYRTRATEQVSKDIIPSGDYVRCPTCGYKVLMPCLYCTMTQRRAACMDPLS